METRYDSYYEKKLAYKMTLEELLAKPYKKEEDILAYIRYVGVDNFRVILPADPPQNITLVPFVGIALCSGEKVPTLCRMVNETDPLYNPLIERDTLRRNHWYHPYKIKFTPVEYQGVNDRYYFSDFCSIVQDGFAKIVENKQTMKGDYHG